MKNKKFLLLVVMAFVVALVAACSGGDNGNNNNNNNDNGGDNASSNGEEVTIEFMTISLSPTFDDYINGVIDKFEEENPGVTVKWIDEPMSHIRSEERRGGKEW